MKTVKVEIEISSCKQCPHFRITGGSSTDGFDYGDVWHCTKADKNISEFVEWNDDPEIPNWCPYIKNKI